jgi:hypothetical protein
MNGDELKALIVSGLKQPDSVLKRARDLIAAGAKAASARAKKK